MRTTRTIAILSLAAALGACARTIPDVTPREASSIERRLGKYTTVRLTTDLAALTERERRMLPLLIDAAKAMDDAFWFQAYGNRDSLLAAQTDPALRRYIAINYGPWDRLENNQPFVAGVGEKPKGANLYPADMTVAEFEAAVAESPSHGAALKSLYTVVRRDPNRKLVALAYRDVFRNQVRVAAGKLREAAALADDPGLKTYLELRATALETDDYQPSDLAWMDMKNNTIDVVIGPIETYEDQLFGYKASFETFVLVKDRAWSQRLARYASLLPALQRGLPVPEEFKRETPGTDSDLNAYDAVYYAGDANAGSKTIAINLPNDEEVQLRKGTRRLQLKNAMRAKFDEILLPIARELIAEEQLRHVTFDAFFENVMFHEVAHGLGIKNTLNDRGTVREALKERAGSLEEGKADVLGLYMVKTLNRQGELGQEDVRDNYVTFLAGLFRSVRFGASSAHGRANVLQFNFLMEQGAFTRDEATGRYRVNFDRVEPALDALAEKILRLQGMGDYEGVGTFATQSGAIGTGLRADLDRLATRNIPVDIVFEQGLAVLHAGR
jgi:hypothetical protein